MVKIMQLKNLNQYIHETQIQTAPTLHKLFNKKSAPFEIPTAKELIIEKLTWFKWFEKEYEDICIPFSEDAECQELCKLINVDWQDLDISVIDEFLDNKQKRIANGDRLTFIDFR